MNKTININLGGLFFHIDENAYIKLDTYLKTIQASFAGDAGEDEIITDIEIRIAELFTERLKHEKQVVSINEVDYVINIMGQPEDYIVDEDIFEETNQNKKTYNSVKKIYRDIDNKYIGGVSSGLGHYVRVDALWIRLLWIILFFTFGTGVLLYIILWILVPGAKTTSEKIEMTGDTINISNIEKKIKEGINSATDTVKNVDYQKYRNQVQSGISSFFDTLGNITSTLFNILTKIIGMFLIIIGTLTIISLLIGMISTLFTDLYSSNLIEVFSLYDVAPNIPIWIIGILIFFALGIPFFFIAYLGFKIVANNLKSIGNVAKLSLLGVWIFALIGLIFLGVNIGIKQKSTDFVIEKEKLNITKNDTLKIVMNTNENFSSSIRRSDNEKFIFDENDKKHIFSQDISLIVKSTNDSLARIKVKKSAQGASHDAARERAQDIDYQYDFKNNILSLNNYFLASPDQKFNGQEIQVTLFLPEESVLYADKNIYHYNRNTKSYNDILENEFEEHYLKILKNDTECLDCSEMKYEDDNNTVSLSENGINIKIDDNGEKGKVIIDENGIDIDINEDGEKGKVSIGKNGIDIDINEENGNNIKLKINDKGININNN